MMSVDYLRDETVLNGNIDGEVIEPFILKAQNLHIETALGTDLYNKIISELIANTLTGNYKTLLDDYIHPALIEWSLYLCIPFVNYKFTNKAITTASSDNSDSIEIAEMKYLREEIKNVAEYYSTRLTSYISNNESLFPEYGTTDCDNIQPSKSTYFNGIEF